jgi:tetratricopeptide (TPR) repeat protein
MDCRKSVWAGFLLLGALAGCTPQMPLVSSSAPPGQGETVKRAPRPSTCVSYGDLLVQEATAPTRTPESQQSLREQARKSYQQALALDPKCLAARRGLANIYSLEGQADKALAELTRATKIAPKDAALWYDLGMCYNRQKQWRPAIEALIHAVECEPDNRQYYTTLGYTYARAGGYEQALACFQRCGTEARAHYNLARMLLHLNQEDLGRQHLTIAVQKDPSLAAAQQLFAEIENKEANSGLAPVGFEEEQPPAAPQQ